MKYAAHGKQVQRGSEHVADAADETWAQIITDALNDRGAMTDPGGTVMKVGNDTCSKCLAAHPVTFDCGQTINVRTAPDAAGYRYEGVIPYHSSHNVTRHIDGYRCSCGHRWDSDAGGDECPVASARSKAWNDAKMRLMAENGPEYIVPNGSVAGYDLASEPSETIHMISHTGRGRPEHIWQRQQDEYACSCGARWDVSDGDEHPPTR